MSYMRQHVPDMDAIMDVVEKHGLILIEDCAPRHATLWNGKLLGTFGEIGWLFLNPVVKGLSPARAVFSSPTTMNTPPERSSTLGPTSAFG